MTSVPTAPAVRRTSDDLAAGLVVLALAVVISVAGPSQAAPLVAAGLVSIGVFVLALSRAFAFVLLAVAVRASLDVAKVDGGTSLANPASLLALFMLGFGLCWLAFRRAEVGRHDWSPVQVGLMAVSIAAVSSTVTSQAAGTSAVECVRLLSALVVFVLLERMVRSEHRARLVVAAVFASAIIPLLWVLVGMATGDPPVEVKDGIERLTGTFTQSNPFAHFLLVLLAFGAGLLRHLDDRRVQRLLGAFLVVLGGLLALTYTRNAWLGLVPGVVPIPFTSGVEGSA